MSGYIAQSKTVEWATPQALFDRLDAVWRFTVDVAADAGNAKCARFYDEAADGLAQSWAGERAWCNPPYGRGIGRWVEKAAQSVKADPSIVVLMLVPSRTDVAWFHDHCLHNPDCAVEFLRGRLKFGDAKVGAPFPSMLLTFRARACP